MGSRCDGPVIMAAESIQNEKVLASASPNPPVASCRKTKRDDTMFLEDLKDHIDEFIHASMDEHKSCFQKTINKMFGMSKVVAERHAADATGVEVSLPLQTTVSD